MLHWLVRRIGRNLWLAAAILLVPISAAAQTRDPRSFDIAGVRLGMSADQVMQALRAAGYGPKYNRTSTDPDIDRGPSFAYQAHQAAEAKLGAQLPNEPQPNTAVLGIAGKSANGEIAVAFRDFPDGPRATAVIYRGGQAMRDRAGSLDELARSKYGPPTATATVGRETTDYWCSPGVKPCGERSTAKPRLSLLKFGTGGRTLTLFAGDIEDSRSYQLVQAEGAKIAAAVKAGKSPSEVSAAAAAGAKYQASRRDPSTFDIGGAKLGMTPDQVTAALAAGGYSPSPRFPPSQALSYEQAIEVRAKEFAGDRRYYPEVLKGIELLTFEHPSGGIIRVGFINLLEGPRVKSVHYQIAAKQMDRKLFLDRVDSKYGPPSISTDAQTFWCTKALGACSNISDAQNGLFLAVERHADHQGNFTLVLNDGGRPEQNLRAAIDAEARRRAGSN